MTCYPLFRCAPSIENQPTKPSLLVKVTYIFGRSRCSSRAQEGYIPCRRFSICKASLILQYGEILPLPNTSCATGIRVQTWQNQKLQIVCCRSNDVQRISQPGVRYIKKRQELKLSAHILPPQLSHLKSFVAASLCFTTVAAASSLIKLASRQHTGSPYLSQTQSAAWCWWLKTLLRWWGYVTSFETIQCLPILSLLAEVSKSRELPAAKPLSQVKIRQRKTSFKHQVWWQKYIWNKLPCHLLDKTETLVQSPKSFTTDQKTV